MLLDPNRSFLLIVDVQERLAPAIHGIDGVTANVRRLAQAAARLSVPVRALEENPDGLGATIPEVREVLPPDAAMAKMYFSGAREPAVLAALNALDRPLAVVAGTETHVCVLQTALGLKAEGYAPVVVADASGSRRRADHDAGLARLRDHGCPAVTSEMVLFEWLERAGTDAFREVLKLIR